MGAALCMAVGFAAVGTVRRCRGRRRRAITRASRRTRRASGMSSSLSSSALEIRRSPPAAVHSGQNQSPLGTCCS
eukprot:42715-Chlamydomonas_euryale.AAC.1